MARALGTKIVGEPVVDEHHDSMTGDGLQETTNGLMVWRKADNWTAFTDGYQTWINGPNGIQKRLNDQRFEWENNYCPLIYSNPNPSDQGSIRDIGVWKPHGFLIHGSHSGRRTSIASEFHGTRGFAHNGAGGLAWTATVGEDMVSFHLPFDHWGYHAREYSYEWIGIEIAKAMVEDVITEPEIKALAWTMKHISRWYAERGMGLRTDVFAFHSQVPPGIRDGKVDPYPRDWTQLEGLKNRLIEVLEEV